MKILIIAHHFPPATGARASQMLKVCELLAQAGHELCVIAALEKRLLPKSHSRSKMIGQLSFPWEMRYVTTPYSSASKLWRATKLLPDFVTSYHFASTAGKLAIQTVHEWKPDVLFTVSSPVSSHLAGYKVKQVCSDLPWAVFFSDPFPSSILPSPYDRGGMFQFHSRSLVKRILHTCNAVMLTSQFARKPFEEVLGMDLSDRVFTVPHVPGELSSVTGLSDQEVRKHVSNPAFGKSLVYTGSIGPERTIPELLIAAKQVREKYPDRFEGIYVFDKNINGTFQRKVAELQAGSIVHHAGRVSHNAAYQLMKQAKCNLVIEANMPYSPFCPSKYADCIGVGRPVLSITPQESEISRLTSLHKSGVAVGFSVSAMTGAMERIFLENHPSMFPNQGLAGHFSRENILVCYETCFGTISMKSEWDRNGRGR